MKSNLPYYEVDGTRYPRLTRILSILRDPEVEEWMTEIGMAAAKRRQASSRNRGTLLHKMVSKTLQTGKEASLPRGASFELRMCWQAWRRWYRLHRPTMTSISVESPFVSVEHGYGCTPDLVEDGMVTDWKTGSRLTAKHWIQVHAEVPLVFGAQTTTSRVRLVRLDPAVGDFEEQIRSFDCKVWEIFLHLKQVYMAWYHHELQPEGAPNDRT